MTAPKKQMFLVVTADARGHMVEADNALVDEQGNLNLWLGPQLVGAFGRGFWCSCTVQPEGKTDG